MARRRINTATLDLNFAAGTYQAGATSYGSISAVPGYGCTRSGQVGAVDTSGAVAWFATDVPPINDYGLHSYGALTNVSIQSQAFDSSSWAKGNATIGANALAAPDGTTTADTLTTAASGITKSIAQTRTVTPSTAYTAVIFVKRGTSVNCYKYSVVDVTHSTDIIARTDYSAQVDAGGAWSRIVISFTTPAGCTQVQFLPVNSNLSEHSVTLSLWQAQIIQGSFPVGGPPLIATTTASVTVGAQDLRVGMANGTYTATYTFDDDSTQDVSKTVAGNVLHLDTYPAVLNRPRVKRVQVA